VVSAVLEPVRVYGLPVVSVLRLDDLAAHLEAVGDARTLAAVRAYRKRYGVL
jgi:hypothetical protein